MRKARPGSRREGRDARLEREGLGMRVSATHVSQTTTHVSHREAAISKLVSLTESRWPRGASKGQDLTLIAATLSSRDSENALMKFRSTIRATVFVADHQRCAALLEVLGWVIAAAQELVEHLVPNDHRVVYLLTGEKDPMDLVPPVAIVLAIAVDE